MIIEINDTRTVGDIQQDFSTRFPLLKLEFFPAPHEREEPSRGTPCQPSQLLGEIRTKHVQGTLTVDPYRETGDVEKEFQRRFGLNVQIYRFQMTRWIQTAGTDILLLREQNEIAGDSLAFYNPDHEQQRD